MSLDYYTSGIVLELDAARCSGCGRCIEVCPHDVFQLEQSGTSARQRAVVARRQHCMECGACALNCPARAIRASAGVGCAAAIIYGMINGTEPTCECSGKRETKPSSCGCGSGGCN